MFRSPLLTMSISEAYYDISNWFYWGEISGRLWKFIEFSEKQNLMKRNAQWTFTLVTTLNFIIKFQKISFNCIFILIAIYINIINDETKLHFRLFLEQEHKHFLLHSKETILRNSKENSRLWRFLADRFFIFEYA